MTAVRKAIISSCTCRRGYFNDPTDCLLLDTERVVPEREINNQDNVTSLKLSVVAKEAYTNYMYS